MKVPQDSYTLDTFLRFLQEHNDEVFDEADRKKWLKVYGVLHNLGDWRSELFRPAELRRLGELAEISLKWNLADGSESDEQRFYAVEYQPGLLLFFTSSIQESYGKTLARRIRETRGATEAWVPPPLFQELWQTILEDTKGYVYRFTSRRGALDDTPARVRPRYARRFNYTGDDGTFVVKELQEIYGVTPDSMYIRAGPSLTLQITNNGFFAAREISTLALQTMLKVFETISTGVIRTKTLAEEVKFEARLATEGDRRFPLAAFKPGVIKLKGRPLTSSDVQQFVKESTRFSFVDIDLHADPVGFSSVVVDEEKRSVFNVTMNEGQISLVPKCNTTFESFLQFYRNVADLLDEHADFLTWAEAK